MLFFSYCYSTTLLYSLEVVEAVDEAGELSLTRVLLLLLFFSYCYSSTYYYCGLVTHLKLLKVLMSPASCLWPKYCSSSQPPVNQSPAW